MASSSSGSSKTALRYGHTYTVVEQNAVHGAPPMVYIYENAKIVATAIKSPWGWMAGIGCDAPVTFTGKRSAAEGMMRIVSEGLESYLGEK